MKTEISTIAETDRIVFGYCDADKAEYIELRNSNSVKEIAEASEKLGCSPLLIDALISLVDTIADCVGKDLKDIWKRLDP